MHKNYYLHKFAELAQTTDAVSNAKNVAGGKSAEALNLPLPKVEDTSKPEPIGVKKPLTAPSFKGILNPLPTTGTSLTKSANTSSSAAYQAPIYGAMGPSYEDAQRFWKDKNTRAIRDEFQSRVNALRAAQGLQNKTMNLSDNLYDNNKSWYSPRNLAATPFAAATDLLTQPAALGMSIPNMYRVHSLQKYIEKYPELRYADMSFEGPTAAISRNNNEDLQNSVDSLNNMKVQPYQDAAWSVVNTGLSGVGLGAPTRLLAKQPLKSGLKSISQSFKKHPVKSTLAAGTYSALSGPMPEDNENDQQNQIQYGSDQ